MKMVECRFACNSIPLVQQQGPPLACAGTLASFSCLRSGWWVGYAFLAAACLVAVAAGGERPRGGGSGRRHHRGRGCDVRLVGLGLLLRRNFGFGFGPRICKSNPKAASIFLSPNGREIRLREAS